MPPDTPGAESSGSRSTLGSPALQVILPALVNSREHVMAQKHKWTFFRAGGFDQVKLESGADLMNLDKLDKKLWVALACPTSGLEIDSRTLDLIDSDKNGRIRPGELIEAIGFAAAQLKNPDDLLKGEPGLPLASIDDSNPVGKVLLSSARQILSNIGKPEALLLSVEDVSDRSRIFANTAFNGDGIITELSASTEPVRAVIREIIECIGCVPDLSGKPGILPEMIDAFFAEAKAFDAWYVKGDAEATAVFPLGRLGTADAVSVITAIKPKVDDYFARCRLTAYDPRTEQVLNRKEEEYLALAANDLSITAAEVAGFPLSHVGPERPLPLMGPVNPAHAAALANLAVAAVKPILGTRDKITESEWHAVMAKVAPYRAWQEQKAGLKVEQLGEKRIREILESNLYAQLNDLVAKDKALESETASIEQVERLVRYYRDIALLCTNFVNFKDFYDGAEPSIFQCGTLYLDQRECRLCLRVEDPAKHAIMAGLAGAYLAYLDCTRKESNEKMQIVAAFTAGDSDNLMVGRNGIFYDRKGRDWDATIVKIVDNPISIRQAFWSPYKKFVRFLEEQVNKRAAAADAEAHDKLAATAATTVNADKAKLAVPKKIDVGTVAAIGVAAGAIGTFVTALIGYLAGILKLGVFPTLAALAGVVFLISMPSVIMAYIKLRKRNLGPILDANGWAVNAKAKFNVPFGATLSSVAKLPPGSRRDSSDPYADKGFPWKRALVAFLLLYVAYRWSGGSFDRVLPSRARAGSLLGPRLPWFHPSKPEEFKP
ncbi:MAG: hypothetical protein JWO30_3713 [Fibrobacteres bacterium]|nr:hypothetical protein [Fibrobacterota bacterium]